MSEVTEVQDEKNLEKKENRVNVRFNDKQIQELDKICEDKGVKSRSKILKSALELVTNGTSDIDFGITADFTKEKRKTIQFEDDKKILSNCPHCAGKIRLDPEHYKKFQKEILVLPSHMPGYQCKDATCTEVHTNPRYATRPRAICTICFQLAKEVKPQCVWCRQINTLKSITPEQLQQMKIVNPIAEISYD